MLPSGHWRIIRLIHISHHYEFDPIFRIIFDESLRVHYTYLRRTLVLRTILMLCNFGAVNCRVLSKYTDLSVVNRKRNHSLFRCFRVEWAICIRQSVSCGGGGCYISSGFLFLSVHYTRRTTRRRPFSPIRRDSEHGIFPLRSESTKLYVDS